MLKRAVYFSFALCLVASARLTFGQTFTFGLDGSQEVPPNASPATGLCTVVVDDPTDTVDVSCTYSGLLSNTTAAHIHAPAPPGMNAGVVIPLILVPASAMAGSINQTDLPTSQTNIDHILAGNGYLNIHTEQLPGGEIRGQIVPEPSSVILVLGGILAISLRRRISALVERS